MRTGFGKSPVPGPVRVGHSNLAGDGQADRRYHGGPDMAVLAYSADHYPAWRSELDWPELPLGGFGENLSIEGAAEDSAASETSGARGLRSYKFRRRGIHA
jgi:MOSC domain-containing protein YiiM